MMKIYWQRLAHNLARSNESFSMELSGAWEPTYKKSACRFGVGKRFLCRVYSQNMGRQSKARTSSKSFEV